MQLFIGNILKIGLLFLVATNLVCNTGKGLITFETEDDYTILIELETDSENEAEDPFEDDKTEKDITFQKLTRQEWGLINKELNCRFMLMPFWKKIILEESTPPPNTFS